MKAVRLHHRGGFEQIVFEDAPLPLPKTDEIRIKVHAAGITPGELTWNETYRTPDGSVRLPTIPCHDVSGTVDSIGTDVNSWIVGDSVYGLVDHSRNGSAAQYVTVPATDVAMKPESLDFLHAAAVPVSALTAWQTLIDHGRLTRGDRVLIHGAAGGVGAYAVQLARCFGAEVIATASGRHADFLQKLGATTVIDYHTTRFEIVAKDVSIVLDTLGGETRARSWSTLKPGGTLVALTAPIPEGSSGRSDVRGVFFAVRPNRHQLTEIARLIDAGHVRPFIEETFPLSEGRRAFERAAAGHLGGKVMLRVIT